MYQVPGTRYTTLSLNVRTVCILIVIQNRVFRDRVAWELLKVPVMYLVPGGMILVLVPGYLYICPGRQHVPSQTPDLFNFQLLALCCIRLMYPLRCVHNLLRCVAYVHIRVYTTSTY